MRKIYDYNEEQYTKDTPEFMYFLGLVASDGVLERYHIKITLQSADSGLLESLRDSIVPKKPLYYVKTKQAYNYNPGSEYYTLQYTCGQTKKFFNIIYENKNFYMKRKYNKFLEKFANLG